MQRIVASLFLSIALSLAGIAAPVPASAAIKTQLPPSIEGCFKSSLAGILDMRRSDQRGLFDFFLAHIHVDQFGRYNFKRAWTDWAGNPGIQRLALYEYFKLMTGKRAEHGGGTANIEARLADNPAVRGNNVYHIIATIGFADGSSASIVVFSVGCKPFGFMYGGVDLRALVDVNLIERMYRQGVRSPL